MEPVKYQAPYKTVGSGTLIMSIRFKLQVMTVVGAMEFEEKEMIVITHSFERAKQLLDKLESPEILDVTFLDARAAVLEDYRVEHADMSCTIFDLEELMPVVMRMESIPPDSNPLRYDAWDMATDLVRGWMAMHNGFDNKESPTELPYIKLISTRSGDRFHVSLPAQLIDWATPRKPISDDEE